MKGSSWLDAEIHVDAISTGGGYSGGNMNLDPGPLEEDDWMPDNEDDLGEYTQFPTQSLAGGVLTRTEDIA
jgi:hypothetical protein